MHISERQAAIEAITRRVLELNPQRRYDPEFELAVQDRVDGMADVTKLDPQAIDSIARQLARPSHAPGRTIPTHWRWLFGAVALLLVLLLVRAMQSREATSQVEPLDPIPALESPIHVVRAQLQRVLSQLDPVRRRFAEACQADGGCPRSMAELSLNPADFASSDHIAALDLTDSNGILVVLGPVFGEGERLLLQATVTGPGAPSSWQCYTTLDPQLLGGPDPNPCQHRDQLP